MKLKGGLTIFAIFLTATCSQKYTEASYVPGIEKEQGLSFNVDMYRFSSQYDYYSNTSMSFKDIQNDGSKYCKNLNSTFSSESSNYLYTDKSVFLFSSNTNNDNEAYKYCYTFKPSFTSTGLVINHKPVEALFYFPSHLESCLKDSLTQTNKITTFLEIASFYKPLSNYQIDEINKTISLEYHIKEEDSSSYRIDSKYVLTLFVKEGKIHIQKSKNK